MLKKSKYYFISINRAVRNNNIASIYSIIFLVFKSLTNILKEFPNITHKDIDGKQTNGAVAAKKIVALKKFSSSGKKPATAVIATVHAFGFINWNKEAS